MHAGNWSNVNSPYYVNQSEDCSRSGFIERFENKNLLKGYQKMDKRNEKTFLIEELDKKFV